MVNSQGMIYWRRHTYSYHQNLLHYCDEFVNFWTVQMLNLENSIFNRVLVFLRLKSHSKNHFMDQRFQHRGLCVKMVLLFVSSTISRYSVYAKHILFCGAAGMYCSNANRTDSIRPNSILVKEFKIHGNMRIPHTKIKIQFEISCGDEFNIVF